MTYTDIPVIETKSQRRIAVFAEMPTALQFCNDMRIHKIAFEQMDAKIWQEREAARLASGEYVPLPEYFQKAIAAWANNPAVATHFPHVSSNYENVAFVASHEHGVMDRQTVLAPGRYLQRFYKDFLNENQIREIASDFAKIKAERFKMQLGYTREDFKRVYLGGDVRNPGSNINSCMGGSFDRLPCHPCEVYAGGDLAIAYIEDANKRILARAVCYPEKGMAAYAYATSHEYRVILEEKMRQAGMTKRAPFIGARLLKIPYTEGGENMYMMPHIDSDDSFIHHPESPDHFLVVDYDQCKGNRAVPTSGYMRVC